MMRSRRSHTDGPSEIGAHLVNGDDPHQRCYENRHDRQVPTSYHSSYFSLMSFPAQSIISIIQMVALRSWFSWIGRPVPTPPFPLRPRLTATSHGKELEMMSSTTTTTPMTTSAVGATGAPHIRPRVAVVTGSNTGIGWETARALAVDHGFVVVLACRSQHKAEDAVRRIQEEIQRQPPGAGRGEAVWVPAPLDLSSLASVRSFAAALLQQYDTIDVLVNNAGRNDHGEAHQSPDGFNIMFQSNFLGHFLLTSLLLPHMSPKTPGQEGRVVNLSSVMHHFCHPSHMIHDPEGWKQVAASQHRHLTYNLSKLAALLFTVALNQRYGPRSADSGASIRSISVNPGAVNSDIWRHFPSFLSPIFQALFLNNRQGCSTSVAAAVGDLSTFRDTDEYFYLQPYYLSRPDRVPVPWLEIMGLYRGYGWTQPRLPVDGGKEAAEALWQACCEMTESTWPFSVSK